MATEEKTDDSGDSKVSSEPQVDPKVISPARRRRLHSAFGVGLRNVEQGNHDYAMQMFTQCVVGDPASLEYLEAYFENLHAKYTNKKGIKQAGFMAKSAIKKAVAKKDWAAVLKSGTDILNRNPWDVDTLIRLSEACFALQEPESELYFLKKALDTNPKDPELNKLCAITLARGGHYSQAITCWHRVEQARPEDEEALKMISKLTIERTMPREDQAISTYATEGKGGEKSSTDSQQDAEGGEDEEVQITPEQRLLAAVESDPENASNYLDLADLYAHQDKFSEAQAMTQTALEISGGADMKLRDRLEEYQMRGLHHQLAIAQKRAQEDPSEETNGLVKRFKSEINRLELDVYVSRCERNPENGEFRYELGVRLKRASKFKEAIKNLQQARADSSRKAVVHLELGECFQYIKQYKLGLANYEEAIKHCSEKDPETLKKALYRAGVLASGMKETDAAKRYFTDLANLDFDYRDVAERLDKLS